MWIGEGGGQRVRHGRWRKSGRIYIVEWGKRDAGAICLGKRTVIWDGLAVQRKNEITLMSVWEYKVISSGKGGFATPALLEKFLGDLGRDEWEIIHYQTAPENPLAFSGLARRTTQRDWTLQDAAAAAAKAEAEKLRAEFAAKFEAATRPAPAAEEKAPASFLEEKAAPDDGFRKLVDTSRDDDPEADDEAKDDWDKLTAAEEEELPTFFDALKPHFRRNQRGPGMSVGVDYLAKKWDQSEDDLKGALLECGFAIPEDEDATPVYVEYDGDLFWVNINRRGELWINTKEKPRPVFRAVKGTRVESPAEESKAEGQPAAEQPAAKPHFEPKARREEKPAAEAAPSEPGAPLPAGVELLAKIKPQMRRNRRGPGGSGSASFLSRALKCSEADLMASFTALGLVLPANPNDKSIFVEIAGDVWWLNQDSRGGVWINGREKKDGEVIAAPGAEPSAPAAETPSAPASETSTPAPAIQATAASPFTALRLILKETKTGGFAGKVDRLAEEVGQPVEQLVATLTGVGLKVPEKAREKPVFVEHAGEIFWFNKNAKDELWLNAKASKYADKKDGDGPADDDKKPRRGGRGRKKDSE
jgi:hypothetical protein